MGKNCTCTRTGVCSTNAGSTKITEEPSTKMRGSLNGLEMIMTKVKIKSTWKQTALSLLATIAVTTVFKLMQEQLLDHVETRIDKVK
jgi:hypothetical protein